MISGSDIASYNMTQIASVLAVATVFIGLWTLIATFHSQRRRGVLQNTYVGTCATSVGRWGGVSVGHINFVGYYGTLFEDSYAVHKILAIL